jgi:hypothetical protein
VLLQNVRHVVRQNLGIAPRDRAIHAGAKCARVGATPRNLWAARPQKSGVAVAPARFGASCAATFTGVVVANLRLSIPWTELRVKKVEKDKLKGVILTVFTLLTFFLNVRRTES